MDAAPKSARSARRLGMALALLAGVALMALGLLLICRGFRESGQDFGPLYVGANVLIHGGNVYDPVEQREAYVRYIGQPTTWAHFYLPASSVFVLPLALVSYPAARLTWLLVSAAAMLFGLWRLIRAANPGLRAGFLVLVLGAAICTSSSRWALSVAQVTPVVLCLLCLYVVAIQRGSRWAALACMTIAACLKVSCALPFFGIALARRQFRLAVASACLFVLINAVCLFRMGGISVVADYRANMAELERPDQANYPNPRGFSSMPRLDWAYLLNAMSPGYPLDHMVLSDMPPGDSAAVAAWDRRTFARSNLIAGLLALLALIWLGAEAYRAHSMRLDVTWLGAFLAPLCCLTLLGVYHHTYDIVILLAPVALFLTGPDRLRRLPGIPTFVLMFALYGGLHQTYQVEHFVADALGPLNATLIVRPLGSAVVTVMFAASLVALRRLISESAAAPASTDADRMAVAVGG